MLDDQLRSRLHRVDAEASEASTTDLDADARERVVRAVGEHGPALVRGARARRTAGFVGGLAAAAAAALFVSWRSSDTPVVEAGARPPSEALDAPKASPGLPEAPVAAAQPSNRPCESWKAPAEPRFVPFGESRALDLGSVAFVSAHDGAAVRIVEAAACRTVVELEAGRVAVHAKNLGGGDFVVRAADTEIRVEGTIFSVARVDREVTVEVVEGNVVVSGKVVGRHSVTAGRRIEAVGGAVVESELDEAAHERLVREVSPVVVPADGERATAGRVAARHEPAVDSESEAAGDAPGATADVEGAEQLLSRADALRQADDLDGARRLYRRVGAGTGPNAEAAWLALARMELQAGNPKEAARATAQRQIRFGKGALGPEALWIAVRSHRQGGDDARARAAARELVRRWPDSPQADVARRFLSE